MPWLRAMNIRLPVFSMFPATPSLRTLIHQSLITDPLVGEARCQAMCDVALWLCVIIETGLLSCAVVVLLLVTLWYRGVVLVLVLVLVLMFNVQRSTFNVQRSTFNVQRSTFNVQRSTFNVQRSTFNVQRSMFMLMLMLMLMLLLQLNCFLFDKNKDVADDSCFSAWEFAAVHLLRERKSKSSTTQRSRLGCP